MEFTSRERFGIGKNELYLKKYDSRQCCRGASFYFLNKVLNGELINVDRFNILEIELTHKRYIRDKTERGIDNNKINLLDTEHLLEMFQHCTDSFKWLNLNPGEANLALMELNTIIQSSRSVCGTIHLRDHAMAYACNKFNIYLFDPDYGLLEFVRNTTGFKDFFDTINERKNIRSLSIIGNDKGIHVV